MPTPDFQPNGAPAPKPNLPYAEPNIPNARPTGLPPGMSPPPKTEPPPSNVPIPKPSVPGHPISKPTPKPDFGGKTAKPPRQFPNTNTPRTPGPKPFVPTIPQLVRKIIEYVLEPQPTSDGTPPDYEEVVPEEEPYPDTSNEPELETQECLDFAKYPMLENDASSSIVQLDYFSVAGHVQDNNFGSPSPDLVLIGRKSYKKERALNFNSQTNGLVYEYKEIGKYSSPPGEYPAVVTFKVIQRTGAKRAGDGLFVYDGWSVSLMGPYLKSRIMGMPNPWLESDGSIRQLLYRGRRFVTRFGREAYPCSPQPDDDIQDPNDYDRQQDDKDMPCKFSLQNNTDVTSLQSSTLYYQKFRGCQFHSDGMENFFESGEMEVPTLLHPTMEKILQLQNEALATMCRMPPAELVVPDWMPLKWANVEKLVIMYAEKIGDKYKSAKYQVTIPHWGKNKTDTRNHGFTSISKGQFQLIHEMRDSSRITLNCATSQECTSKMLEFLRGVSVDYRNVITVNPAVRGGVVLAQIEIYPVSARFFKAGTDEIKPEWTVKLV